jgi:acyl-[acyl-carrier-protein]-phospholipid O-acyltransferase / long-chain-fatty-acid--[acyl-carrier-protein] ligase
MIGTKMTFAKPLDPLKIQKNAQPKLWTWGFISLLITNWLTVVNDNLFRWLVIGIGKDYYGPENQGWVLMAGTVCFVAPYILLPSIAGYLADRFSKRNVIVACKFAEIAVMTTGSIAIFYEQEILLFATVFLMGAQSALFAPAKVGIMPEMLTDKQLSSANGWFNLATLTATIIGMGLGRQLKDLTGFKGMDDLWISASVMVSVAVIGSITSVFIPKIVAANTTRRFPWNMVSETVRNLRFLFNLGPLFRVGLGIVFFWTIGALAQLNIDQFADESGALLEVDCVPLLISLVLGVGVGSVLAGFFSRGRIELGLVPWGATGIVIFSALLYLAPDSFINTPGRISYFGWIYSCTCLALLGISAGFFDVPLASYMQYRSPVEYRGAVLSANNVLIFAGIMLTALLFWGMRIPTASKSFTDIPTEYQGTSLSVQQKTRIDQLADEFRTRLKDDTQQNRVHASEFVKNLDDELKIPAMTRLLWIEFSFRFFNDESPNVHDYYLMFPQSDDELTTLGERRLIKDVYDSAKAQPLLTSRQIFLIMAFLSLPIAIYAFWRLAVPALRILLWNVFTTLYRVRVNGQENIPENGGAVLVCNHITWLDGLWILIMTSRRVRMIAWAGNFQSRFMKWLADFSSTILITGGPKSIQKGLAEARKALGRGELVGIFPEGGISKTGQIQSFRPGVMKILEKTPVPVLPIYFDQTWGSIFSYSQGKTIKKIPNFFRRPVTINIGKPHGDLETLNQVRNSLTRLGSKAVNQRQPPFVCPASSFIRMCKKRKFGSKLGDSTGANISGAMVLARALILRRLLNRGVFNDQMKNVGVLLPPSAGGVITNMALALDKRTAVNLNYTTSSETMNHCIKMAGITKVLTSRKVMEKFDFQLDTELVYLEDLVGQLTRMDKIKSFIEAYVLPASTLERSLGLSQVNPHDVLTIIFTSGSTGTPKGVLLTQQNVATNVEAVEQMVRLTPRDTLIGVLPLFHSFGYTVCMWCAMGLDIRGVYHFNPLEGKQVGKLCSNFKGTVLLATPTFLRTYLRKCTPEELKTVDVVVTGAERLPVELADAFENKFHVRPVEGYGATELSPLVSVNVPPSRTIEGHQLVSKEGTVGRPIPNVSAKIIHLDTNEECDINEIGMLWIAGPNVMKGYLDRDDLTREVLVDGWYCTGDVAMIDSDGFIKITGRVSRFSKIGGEMIPHVKIEDALTAQLEEDEQDVPRIAVTSVSDEKKGERLVVLYTELSKSVDQLITGLTEAKLPNLFIPSKQNFYKVPELPLLGTGKLDLRQIKTLAEEKSSEAANK